MKAGPLRFAHLEIQVEACHIARKLPRSAHKRRARKCPRQMEFCHTHRATQNGCCISKWGTFWSVFQPEFKFRVVERIYRAVSHRHRYPGQVHPADRLGQTVATGPGCLSTSHPRQLGWHFSVVSLLDSASGRKSLDRSRKLSRNSTSSTSGVPAGNAGQLLAITSLK